MKLIINLLVMLMTLGAVGGVVALLVVMHYSADLPDYQQLANYDPPNVSRLYAADGRLLEEYAKEKRIFVPIETIPKALQEAFIAAEDKNFYKHPGIDFIGIGRAVMVNASNMGKDRALVGGSTITQQVVKNFLLTREQSFERKIKEAILAFRISKVFSKDKVLELYLNQIYLGVGSYGVAAAALNYFNKSIDELTIDEMAFLAALPKAPSRYHPKRRYDDALDRRNWVIKRMQEDGYISWQEASDAMARAIIMVSPSHEEVVTAHGFAEEVRRQLLDKYGDKTLYQGGLVVHTTFRPKLQAAAEKALLDGIMSYERRHGYKGPLATMPDIRDWKHKLAQFKKPQGTDMWHLAVVLKVEKNRATIGLASGAIETLTLDDVLWARPRQKNGKTGKAVSRMLDVVRKGHVILAEELTPEDDDDSGRRRFGIRHIPDVNGAVIALNPHNGHVYAMVGGLPFKDTSFNRVTQAKRQPGSAFKPFIFLSGMESGYSPSSIILDAPISIPQAPHLPAWKPQNYSNKFYGPTTLRAGLQRSQNVLTVRLAQLLGLPRIKEVGVRFGIYDEDAPSHFSMVLGSQETTLMRLARAYAMIVNGGHEIDATIIDRIQNRRGQLIYRSDERQCNMCSHAHDASMVSDQVPVLQDDRAPVTDAQSAFQVLSMMEGVVKYGTSRKALAIGKPVAGKTGTTNDSRDSWFMGFTPDLVIGVYVGYDQPKPLGKKETGSSIALPIFTDLMTSALKDTPSAPFRTPKGMQLFKVDRTTGMRPQAWTEKKHIILEAFKPDQQPPTSMRPIGGYAAEVTSDSTDPYQEQDSYYERPALTAPLPRRSGGRRAPSVGTGGLY